MVSFGIYAALSTLALATTVGYAKHTREQFYSTVIFLVDTKFCVFVIGNFCFFLTILFGKMFKNLFFGRLRSGEVNAMMDKARYAVVETCLTLIIFREEISVRTVALFTALLFSKIFHWLAASRLEYIEQSQITGTFAYTRLAILLLLLIGIDSLFLGGTVDNSFNANGEFVPSVLIYFGFESSILFTAAFSTSMKFGLHLIELSSSGQWHNKSIYKFYLELFINAIRSVLYIIFFLIIFVYYGLPMHLIRDLWLSLKNLVKEWHQFRRYRKLCRNMHSRFPDATQEQLEEHPDCIICREQMVHGEHAKVLPCGHIFHFYCLRSWLERQQTCPYCRANIPEDTTRRVVQSPRAVPQQQQQQQPQQQDQRNNNNMLPGFDADGRPMMPPDEAARRAAFTRQNMRNIRFMTEPRRFPPPLSSSQQMEKIEEKEDEQQEQEEKKTDEDVTPATFRLPAAAPTTPQLLQQVSASSTTSTTSISTPALRVTPSFTPGTVPILLTPLPLAPPLTPTPSPGVLTGSPIEVQLQQMQMQMSSLQRQVQELITLQRAQSNSSTRTSSSNSTTIESSSNTTTTTSSNDNSPSAQIRRRRLRYFQKKEEGDSGSTE